MLSPISNILVFDTETTGLSPEKNSMIELACCPITFDLVDLKEYESGVFKVYDNREINEGALRANGITRDQIENGHDSKKIADDFIKYLKSLTVGRNKPILAGHNIDKFDIPFLTDFLKVHKHDLSKYVNLSFTLDTMWLSRLRWAELTNFKLGTCCEEAGVELINAHRALADTRANKDLLKFLLRAYRGESSTQSNKEEYIRPVFEF